MRNTINHLLKDRYIVIAPTPYSVMKIGDIITVDREVDNLNYDYFTHLFRKLEWFEHLPVELFPKYVKKITGEGYFLIGDFLKVKEWSFQSKPYGGFQWRAFIGGEIEIASNLMPVSEFDFNNAPKEHAPIAGR